MFNFKLILIYCLVFFWYKVFFLVINEYENENNDNLICIIICFLYKMNVK